MYNAPALSTTPPPPPPLTTLTLPNRTEQLIALFQSSPHHHERICALAKIKSQILSVLHQPSAWPPSPDTSQAVELLFFPTILHFIKRQRNRNDAECKQSGLFYHVAGLAIKYYFREQAFRQLMAEVTDLIDGYPQRIKPALSLFSQIITTIENSFQDNLHRQTNQLPRCLFERHLTTVHLNSMMILADFCIERGVVKEGYSLQDAPSDQCFHLKAPEDTLLAAFRLLRAVLCYDWLGQKYNEFEEVSESSLIVIPTKGTKQTALTEFEKWLKNSEWVRLYYYLYKKCRLVALKLQILQLLGDMARIHMKFFKNKNNYRMHIENIVFTLGNIIDEFQLSKNCQESIQLAIAVGANLNKLTISGVGPILFEINLNFFRGILENIKKFITEQVIGEEIFNINLLYYFFKFLDSILVKSSFERTSQRFQQVEQRIRQICRSYEHYIRVLFNKIAKSPIRCGQAFFYRTDCSRLAESLRVYECKQLQIYFLPFRLMKPRYASTNSIQELFVYITARVTRALNLLTLFKLEEWERELAHSILVQSIQKINQWFGYTSYRRTPHKLKNYSATRNIQKLATIREQYQEEIDNEDQYCHALRLTAFMVIDQFSEQKPSFYLKMAGTVIKIIGITIQLCLTADLQDKDSEEMKHTENSIKIEQALQMCLQVACKVLIRQFQLTLFYYLNSKNRKQPYNYQYQYLQSQFTHIDIEYTLQKQALLELISKLMQIQNTYNPKIIKLLTQFHFLLTCSFASAQTDRHAFNIPQSSKQILICLQAIASVPTLTILAQSQLPKLADFLANALQFLRSNGQKPQQLIDYLSCLRLLAQMSIQDYSEQAMNKLYVTLKCLLPFLGQQIHVTGELAEELGIIVFQMLLKSKQLDFVELGNQLRHKLQGKNAKPERMELQTTCLSISLQSNQQQNSQCQLNQSNAQQQNNQDIKSQPQQIPVKKQTPIKKEEFNYIYNGYHRQGTMRILGKYIEQNQSQDKKQTQPPAQNHQDKQPMEIEEQYNSIQDIKVCLDQIHQVQSHNEHSFIQITSPPRHTQIINLNQILEDQLYIPLVTEDLQQTAIKNTSHKQINEHLQAEQEIFDNQADNQNNQFLSVGKQFIARDLPLQFQNFSSNNSSKSYVYSQIAKIQHLEDSIPTNNQLSNPAFRQNAETGQIKSFQQIRQILPQNASHGFPPLMQPIQHHPAAQQQPNKQYQPQPPQQQINLIYFAQKEKKTLPESHSKSARQRALLLSKSSSNSSQKPTQTII